MSTITLTQAHKIMKQIHAGGWSVGSAYKQFNEEFSMVKLTHGGNGNRGVKAVILCRRYFFGYLPQRMILETPDDTFGFEFPARISWYMFGYGLDFYIDRSHRLQEEELSKSTSIVLNEFLHSYDLDPPFSDTDVGSEIRWLISPDGTTHFDPESQDVTWIKHDPNLGWYYWDDEKNQWRKSPCGENDPIFDRLIPRPVPMDKVLPIVGEAPLCTTHYGNVGGVHQWYQYVTQKYSTPEWYVWSNDEWSRMDEGPKFFITYSRDMDLHDTKPPVGVLHEGLDYLPAHNSPGYVLTPSEYETGHSRVKYAEEIILKARGDREHRDTWLMNYGTSDTADLLRSQNGLSFDPKTCAACSIPAEPKGNDDDI